MRGRDQAAPRKRSASGEAVCHRVSHALTAQRHWRGHEWLTSATHLSQKSRASRSTQEETPGEPAYYCNIVTAWWQVAEISTGTDKRGLGREGNSRQCGTHVSHFENPNQPRPSQLTAPSTGVRDCVARDQPNCRESIENMNYGRTLPDNRRCASLHQNCDLASRENDRNAGPLPRGVKQSGAI
jgi:hypothetical protein